MVSCETIEYHSIKAKTKFSIPLCCKNTVWFMIDCTLSHTRMSSHTAQPVLSKNAS
jgi:hypothetical protein